MAGCFTPDAPEEAAVESAAADGSATAPAPTTKETPSTSAPTADAAPGAENETPQSFPLSFDGKTSTWVCAPSGPFSCTGLPVSVPGENTFTTLDQGKPVSLDATLTWEATTPVTGEMVLSVFAVRSCGDGCWESDGEMFHDSVIGPSPLALSVQDIRVGENETLVLHVSANEPNPTGGLPVFTFYSVEQEFHVEGTFVAVPPA